MWQHVHKCCRLVGTGDTSDYLITEVLWKLKQYARIYNIEKNEWMNIIANTCKQTKMSGRERKYRLCGNKLLNN